MKLRDTLVDILAEVALLAIATWAVMLLLCAAYNAVGYLTYRPSKRGRR